MPFHYTSFENEPQQCFCYIPNMLIGNLLCYMWYLSPTDPGAHVSNILNLGSFQ